MLVLLSALGLFLLRKQIVKAQLENMLQSKVSIGEVYIDFTTHYPITHITLTDVRVAGTNPDIRDTVLYCAQADIEINLWNLYFNARKKTVERVQLTGNRLNMILDAKGRNNFRLFKPYDPERKRPDEVEIKHLDLLNTRIDYAMVPLRRHYALHIGTAQLDMRNWRKHIRFEGKVEGISRYIDLGGFRILTDEPFTVNARMQIDKATKLMTFERLTAQLAESQIALEGKLLMTSERYYDIRFGTNYGKLAALMALLPDNSVRALRNYQVTGEMALQGSIVGRDDETSNPHIRLSFQTRNTQIVHKRTQTGFRGLRMSGRFTNGSQNTLNTTELCIDTLQAVFAGKPIYAQLRLSRFHDLYVEGKLDATVEVSRVLQFAGVSDQLKGTGSLRAQLDLAGAVRNLSSAEETQHVRYNGFLELNDIALQWHSLPLQARQLNGKLELVGRDLLAQELRLRLNEQPLMISARSKDFLSYIYRQSPVLDLNTRLQLDTLYIPKLLANLAALKAHTQDTGIVKPSASSAEQVLQILSRQLPDAIRLEMGVRCPVVYINPQLSTSADLSFAIRQQQLTLHHLLLGGSRSQLRLSGWLSTGTATTSRFALDIDGHTYHLQQLLQETRAMPPILERADSPVELKGLVQLNGTIHRHRKAPRYEVNVQLTQGFISQPGKNIRIENLRGQTKLNEAHLLRPLLTQLQLDSLSGLANGFPFRASMRLVDLYTLDAHILLASTISADVFLRYFTIPQIARPQGTLDFSVTLNGNLRDLANPEKLIEMPETGYLTISQGGFTLEPSHMPFTGVEARMYYDGSGVRILYFNGQMQNSHFAVSGQVKDILPFLYTENAPLIGNITYVGDTLDLESFVVLGEAQPPTSKEETTEENIEPRTRRSIALPERADLRAEVFVQHAYYQKLRMQQVQIDALLKDKVLFVRHAALQTCGGALELSGNIDNTDPQRPMIYSELALEHVDVYQLFQAFDALDEHLLDSLGIRGNLSLRGRILERIDLAQRQVFLPKMARFNLEITEGYIRDLKPFLKPSPLLTKRQLSTPTHFALRADSLHWADSGIAIPRAELISNKLNVLVSGHHDLRGNFRYRLAILQPRRQELEAEDYYRTGKQYDKALWNLTLKNHPKKPVKVSLSLKMIMCNLLRNRKQRAAADADSTETSRP
ncbi:MAG: hypothetical protein KF690_01675 [Bacteroidetes bacterium]|nr:hypothetical protein [Bacteroidota bacterium]